MSDDYDHNDYLPRVDYWATIVAGNVSQTIKTSKPKEGDKCSGA